MVLSFFVRGLRSNKRVECLRDPLESMFVAVVTVASPIARACSHLIHPKQDNRQAVTDIFQFDTLQNCPSNSLYVSPCLPLLPCWTTANKGIAACWRSVSLRTPPRPASGINIKASLERDGVDMS
jgi:hypothetical protein